jgi:hypothetical protein
VQRENFLAKFWLNPTVLASSKHFSIVSLVDGRTIAVPLVWFPRLASASQKQLANYELLGGGEGIHWQDVDEDISVEGLLRGNR